MSEARPTRVRKIGRFYRIATILIVLAAIGGAVGAFLGAPLPGLLTIPQDLFLLGVVGGIAIIGLLALYVSLRPAMHHIADELEELHADQSAAAEAATAEAQKALEAHEEQFAKQHQRHEDSFHALDEWFREQAKPLLSAPQSIADDVDTRMTARFDAWKSMQADDMESLGRRVKRAQDDAKEAKTVASGDQFAARITELENSFHQANEANGRAWEAMREDLLDLRHHMHGAEESTGALERIAALEDRVAQAADEDLHDRLQSVEERARAVPLVVDDRVGAIEARLAEMAERFDKQDIVKEAALESLRADTRQIHADQENEALVHRAANEAVDVAIQQFEGRIARLEAQESDTVQALKERIEDLEAQLEKEHEAVEEIKSNGHLTEAGRKDVEAVVEQEIQERVHRMLAENRAELEQKLAAAEAKLAESSEIKLTAQQIQEVANLAFSRQDKQFDRMRKQVMSDMSAFSDRVQKELDQLTHADLPAEERLRISQRAIEHVDKRFQEWETKETEVMDSFGEWIDEQFAAFLASEALERSETEARVAGMMEREADRHHTPADVKGRPPFGRIYPVMDVQGIGHKTAYALQRMGILDTEHLWHADAPKVASILGITDSEVRRWQCMSELMAISGIGPQYAELLVAAGVRSIADLGAHHTRELFNKIHEPKLDEDSHIQRGRLSEKHVQRWIHSARAHSPGQALYV